MKIGKKKEINVDKDNIVNEVDKEITFIINQIVKHYPLLGLPYLYLGRAYVNEGTAAISANGWFIVNPEWWVKLSPIEKRFVMIHEIIHGLLKHVARMPPSYAKEYNIVADAIANEFALNTLAEMIKINEYMDITTIKEKIEKLSMNNLITWETIEKMYRENGIEPPADLKKRSADELFVLLYSAKKKKEKTRQSNETFSNAQKRKQLQGDNSTKKYRRSGTLITQRGNYTKKYHGTGSPTAQRGDNNKQQDNIDDTRFTGIKNGPIGGDLVKNFDPTKENAKVTKRPDSIFSDNPKMAENAWKAIYTSARNFQKAIEKSLKRAGIGKGAIDELIELAEKNSVISWRKIIKDAVREHYRGFVDRSFKREDRRYSSMSRIHEKKKLYLPGVVHYSIPKLHITIDTSGSMTTEEIRQVVSEMYTIIKSYKTSIRVTQWDYGIQDDRIVSKPEELEVFPVRGRGGTSIIPVLKYIIGEEKFDNKKYMMDKNAILIIFSDFELFDDDHTVLQLLKKLKKQYNTRIIFVNTKNFRVFDTKRHGLYKAFKLAKQT